MPANIVKSPADEKKWDRAKKITRKQKGKIEDDDWGLVTHIFKNMKKGSEKMSNTPYLDAWIEKNASALSAAMKPGGMGELISAGLPPRAAPGLLDLFREGIPEGAAGVDILRAAHRSGDSTNFLDALTSGNFARGAARSAGRGVGHVGGELSSNLQQAGLGLNQAGALGAAGLAPIGAGAYYMADD